MNVSIPFAFFGTRQVLVILAMSILSAGISSALPILKISKEKPVELIRNV
jgi:ABC-type lipoprotein release transport system permease subunit